MPIAMTYYPSTQQKTAQNHQINPDTNTHQSFMFQDLAKSEKENLLVKKSKAIVDISRPVSLNHIGRSPEKGSSSQKSVSTRQHKAMQEKHTEWELAVENKTNQ